MNEQFTRSSVVIRATIPPGEISTFPAIGNAFYMINCAAPVEISLDGIPRKPYRRGTGETLPGDNYFTRIEVLNTNSREVEINLWVGWGKYIDNRFEVIDNATELEASEHASIPGSTSIEFSGVPTGRRLQRKAIIVSNLDVAIPLYITDADGNEGLVIWPQTSVILPTAGRVFLKNATGATVDCRVSEIWFLQGAL